MMKNGTLVLFLFAVVSFGAFAGVWAEGFHPEFSTAGFFQTDAKVREAINFNVGWRFVKHDVPGAEAVDFNDQDWTVVKLPDGMELFPRAVSGASIIRGRRGSASISMWMSR